MHILARHAQYCFYADRRRLRHQVQYEEDANHLLAALRELYVMTEDRQSEQKYVGTTIAHDITNNVLTLSMPGYVEKALQRFGKQDIKGADSPLIYTPPIYGVKQQLTPAEKVASTLPVSEAERKFLQELVGVFLFYSRAVDATMLMALNQLSTTPPSQAALQAAERFLQYAKKWPNSQLIFKASNMQLQAESDASYLSETLGRSRGAGLLFFGRNEDGSVNGMIDTISCIIPTVCSSVGEAEYAALFIVGKELTSARHTLSDLNHPQASTRIVCDNACAVGIANNTVKIRRSKAIDMRYHWIRDQVSQGKFNIHWEAGDKNLADFFTKAHPVWKHKALRRLFVHSPPRQFIAECARSRRIARKQRISEQPILL